MDFDTRQVTRAAGTCVSRRRSSSCSGTSWPTPNKVLPHRELLQAVWGPDYGDQVDYLRVFVNQLRKKIEANPSNPVYLLTEPWVGYRLQLPARPEILIAP